MDAIGQQSRDRTGPELGGAGNNAVNSVDHSVISVISAITALTASIVGPLVSIYVARAQIRATTRSANRQKWIEEFRDTMARFCGQVAVATQIHETIVVQGHVSIPAESHALRDFEQLIYTATRIRLLINPLDPEHRELSTAINGLLLLFTAEDKSISVQREVRDRTKSITDKGLLIIRAEWGLIQHGA